MSDFIPKCVPLRDEKLFQIAMTHRSAAEDSVRDSYERLEFFGDAVLGLVVAEYLYENHPDWDQGMMSKARSSVVQEGPLAETALRIGLDQKMKLAPGEEQSGGRSRPGVLCDLFEATVGAIYLESGLERARWFILDQLHPHLMRINSGDVSPDDHKSRLQEVTQAIWRAMPNYRIRRADESGDEGRFLIEVSLDNEVIGEGRGRTKKEGEQAAAKSALEAIERLQRERERAENDPETDLRSVRGR